MVIINKTVINVLNRIFLVGIAYNSKIDKILVLYVGNLMFAFRKKTLQNCETIVVEEVAQNGIIVTESATKCVLSLMKRRDNIYKK